MLNLSNDYLESASISLIRNLFIKQKDIYFYKMRIYVTNATNPYIISSIYKDDHSFIVI